jgi:hypothetical protein
MDMRKYSPRMKIVTKENEKAADDVNPRTPAPTGHEATGEKKRGG